MSAAQTDDDAFAWRWQDQDIRLGLTRAGSGPRLLLLPAPSSISTRTEMWPLQALLASQFETIAIDLPGFGTTAKAGMNWRPEAYRRFVSDVLDVVRPDASAAAGHMATYLLQHAVDRPASAGRLCLFAPTWRGPLPTMLGRHPDFLNTLARLANAPIGGTLLYRLNVNRWTIKMMGRGHVYADPKWLSADCLDRKLAVTNSPGARHASVRFVCGALDPLSTSSGFGALAERLSEDALVICGTATPRKSMAEIRMLAEAKHVRLVQIPNAKLGVHEEFAAETAATLSSFLSNVISTRQDSPLA